MVYTVLKYKCYSMVVWRLTEPSIFEHTVGSYSLVRLGLTLLVFYRGPKISDEDLQLVFRIRCLKIALLLCYENTR